MPIPSLYNRSPLMPMALTPINDNALRITDPLYAQLVSRALRFLSPAVATPLQCVLATILGGWEAPPEQPDLDGLDPAGDPQLYAENLAAAEFIAMLSRSREELSYFREKLLVWQKILPSLKEADIFATGALMLRTLADYYCRTGDKAALDTAELYRSLLPNVFQFMAGMPIQSAFRAGEDSDYMRRMARFAAHPGQTLSMCVQLARFTGSLTGTEAVSKGFDALLRYHGQANGTLAQDPCLAGKNPSAAATLEGVCEWCDALSDALLLTGEAKYAHRIALVLENALPELLLPEGVRPSCRVNRFAPEPVQPPTSRQMTALLSALLSLRRCMVCRSSDDTVDFSILRSGDFRFRVEDTPVLLHCRASGGLHRDIRISLELKQPLRLSLRIRVPGITGTASLTLNSSDPQPCPVGQTARISRVFSGGDEVGLQLSQVPHMQPGYRGSMSVYCGEVLMALPLPDSTSEFRYALPEGSLVQEGSFEGQTAALIPAVFAPEWRSEGSLLAPPPPGVKIRDASCQLSLLPAVGLNGRVAVLPGAR